MAGLSPVEGRRWRWAAASRVGTSHIRSATRRQDAFAIGSGDSGEVVVVVSDGAGSAAAGAHGARLVCQHMVSSFRSWFRDHSVMPSHDDVLGWIDALRDGLATLAQRRSMSRRDFAATLVGLVIGAEQSFAIQIGDSAVVGRRHGVWDVICWPQNGEYASTTYFVTDDPVVQLTTLELPADYDAFALFTDGVGDLALEHHSHSAHARFFNPMIAPVDAAKEVGCLNNLSKALGQYLDSPLVCERTDDDKTLVLLSGA